MFRAVADPATPVRTPETIDSMTLADLERCACHASALLEQAEALLPGLARLGIEDDLPRHPSRDDRDWLIRRSVLGRLARRAAQLGTRLADAAWCMEQCARAQLNEAARPATSLSDRS